MDGNQNRLKYSLQVRVMFRNRKGDITLGNISKKIQSLLKHITQISYGVSTLHGNIIFG
jgi:hypothetical protein